MARDTLQASPRQRNPLAVPLSASRQHGPPGNLERWLLDKLHTLIGEPAVRLVLWDGSGVGPEQADWRVHLGDRGVLFALLRHPHMAFGDLYSSGRIQVDGDLVGLLEMLYRALARRAGAQPAWLRALWADRSRPGADTVHARGNIQHHYDLGNDFYRLWLDRSAMQYTCAYFETPDLTLEQAQLAKLEHVCRKLRLRPGQQVIEAGCGWGGLARYMAREHGVRVRAYNISREQLSYARQQAVREGVADRVEYIEDDYRNISGQCDAFVSVGMLEHVGLRNYRALASVMRRCLRDTGIGLVHTIGRNAPAPINGWIERRIFPGAYVPSAAELMRLFEHEPFSVLDVENLRLHYAATLQHWRERFLDHRDDVVDRYDDSFARAWELYLAGSEAAFRAGSLQLFQVVFAPGQNNQVPMNRRHLYQESAVIGDA